MPFPCSYVEQAGQMFQAKGANVIVSSQTPDNPWETGTFVYTPVRFVQFAEDSANAIGADYVDHGGYTADFWDRLGEMEVDSFFPIDHTHTSAEGATFVAAAFVKGILCGESTFKQFVKNSTASVFGECL
jgi:rhamnogalacturonan acetylesterase